MKLAAVIMMMMVGLAMGQTNSIVPVMSGYTNGDFIVIYGGLNTGSPVYATYEYGGRKVWYSLDSSTAFDGTFLYYRSDSYSISGGWWGIDMGASVKPVHQYRFTISNYSGMQFASSWALEGSNNYSDWVTLDTQSGYSPSAYVSPLFNVPSTNWGSYRYVRFRLTSDGPAHIICLANMEYFTIVQPLPAISTLQSSASSGHSTLSGNESGITVLK